MKNPAGLFMLLLFTIPMALAPVFAQEEKNPASPIAPAEKIAPPTETALKKSGEIGITKTCGCAAECPEGFNPSEATSCYTAGGECKENGSKCTLTCKKGKEEKKVEGKCTAVYK
jgi:hypothetical protein